jgi:hypothetical protein
MHSHRDWCTDIPQHGRAIRQHGVHRCHGAIETGTATNAFQTPFCNFGCTQIITKGITATKQSQTANVCGSHEHSQNAHSSAIAQRSVTKGLEFSIDAILNSVPNSLELLHHHEIRFGTGVVSIEDNYHQGWKNGCVFMRPTTIEKVRDTT